MLKVRKIGLRAMDLELTTARGVSVRILERPGLWMDEARRERLLVELREVAVRGTHGLPLTYGILSGSKERWDRAILTILRDRATDRLVGFGAMSLLDVRVGRRAENVLHLGLLMLDPGYRGLGFSRLIYGMTMVLALLRRRGRPYWVSNVSQVPAIVGMVAETLDDVHPGPGTRRSARHLAVAREIMARHRSVFGVGGEASFDEDRFVITDAYTGGSDNLRKSYFEAPKHRDGAVNDWCRAELDYARGDDFLQLARFTPRVAWGCFRSFLLRSSVLAPVLQQVGAIPGERP